MKILQIWNPSLAPEKFNFLIGELDQEDNSFAASPDNISILDFKVSDLVFAAGLVESKSDAIRKIKNKAIKVKKIACFEDRTIVESDLHLGAVMITLGKHLGAMIRVKEL